MVPVAEAVRIAREIAAGLAAAHETGLVHRDVKPGNVWLEGKSRRVKLLDFGLARAAGGAGDDDPAEPVTQTGAVVGTPAYMSPEQARGEHVDARTDVFCLGVVLYQLLAGRVPFSAPSVTGVLIAVATETPPAPHDLNPNVAPALGDFVMRLLAKNPAARPPSAAAVVEELLRAEASLSRTGPAVVPVVYVLPSDAPPDPWAGIDVIDPTDANASSPSLLTGAGIEAAPPVAVAVSPATRAPAARKTSFPWLLIGSVFGLLAAVALTGIIVIKIRNKDGTETEIKVPEGSTVEVTKDGKTLGVFPKKDDPTAKKEPPVGVVAGSPWTRVPVGQSPLDKLDPKEIPAEERFDYQPKELVAVIGTHARRMWWTVSAVAVSPDGKLAAISKRSGEVMLWDVATQKPKWPAPMTLGGNMLDFTPDSGRLIVGTSAATAGISVIDVTAAVPSLEQWRTGEKPGAVIEVKGTVVWVLEGGRTLLVRADDLKEQQSRFTLVDISGATSRHTEGELLTHLFWNIVAPMSNEVVYVAVDGKLRRATIKNAKIESDEELPIKVDEKERPRAISPDGKRLALWGGDHLQLWDLGQN